MRVAHRLHSCISIYIEAVDTSSVTSKRMVGDAPANEVLPHWIHGAVSGVKRPTRKKFILEELPNSSETEDMRKIR